MDTDQQVRLSFLEESVEYFEQMEEVLLGLATAENQPQQIDIALRAAHSIKGSAGMMGFSNMSRVAHRLEDFFKILRARAVVLDAELETLFLQGIDCLKEIRDIRAAEEPVDEVWLERCTQPIFEQLQARLGELSEEDENRLLAGDEEVDVALVIFNSGVEDVLTKFEGELSSSQGEELRQLVIKTASQLSNLGLMAELDTFVDLCTSIQVQAQALDVSKLSAFSLQALQAWQRSQSLVEIGRVGNLPTQLNFETSPAIAEATPLIAEGEGSAFDAGDDAVDNSVDNSVGGVTAANATTDAATDLLLTMGDLSVLDPAELEAMQAQMDQIMADPAALAPSPVASLGGSGLPSAAAPVADVTDVQELSAAELAAWQAANALDVQGTAEAQQIEAAQAATPAAPAGVDLSDLQEAIAQINELDLSAAVNAAPATTEQLQSSPPDTDAAQPAHPTPKLSPTADAPATPAKSVSRPPRSSSPKKSQSRSTTLRIASDDLRRINSLFSTLILERNTINLRQQQLVDVAQRLYERMHDLESFNLRLRQWYDRASMEGLVDTRTPPMASDSNRLMLSNSAPISGDFDALEMDQYSELHLMAQEQMETVVQLQEATADLQLGLQEMGQATQKLNGTTRALQGRITRTQMRPFSEIVGRFPRVIRDLSIQHNKQVSLRIEGETTLFERVALEALTDPLNHLLRNCFDHGIETTEERLAAGKPAEGCITIRASQRGNQAQITIVDDGRGIDLDKIRAKVRQHDIPEEHIAQMSERELLSLIFDAGFSTAEKVTELSGRGVGMDVVRNNLDKLKGDIQVETQLGQGSTFTLTLPLSLSVIRIMLLEYQHLAFAVPVDAVAEMLVCQPDTIRPASDEQEAHVLWNGLEVPVADLSECLKFNHHNEPAPLDGVPSINQPLLLIINDSGRYHAIPIDRFWNEQEVAIRPVMSPMPLPIGFSGTTVLGNGRVVPLADLEQLARSIVEHRDIARLEAELTVKNAELNHSQRSVAVEDNAFYLSDEVMNIDDLTATLAKRSVLIIDDSVHVRRYLTMTLEKAGYDVEQARDGQEGVDKLLGGLQVSAVLCDVEMPRLDGYGVLDEIKSRPEFTRLPITMLTSRSSEKHRKLAMNLGAAAYFSKPYNDQELLKALEALIE